MQALAGPEPLEDRGRYSQLQLPELGHGLGDPPEGVVVDLEPLEEEGAELGGHLLDEVVGQVQAL